jgi:hypothetical protein
VVETTESFSLLEINETSKANYAFYDHSTTPAKSTPKNKPPAGLEGEISKGGFGSTTFSSFSSDLGFRGLPPAKPGWPETENSSENSPLLSALKNCVKEQQGLWIRYSGGSNPGTWRKIFPSSISNAQSFRAVGPVTITESKNSGKYNEKEKNFRVDRIVEYNVDINFQPPESKANNLQKWKLISRNSEVYPEKFCEHNQKNMTEQRKLNYRNLGKTGLKVSEICLGECFCCNNNN